MNFWYRLTTALILAVWVLFAAFLLLLMTL